MKHFILLLSALALLTACGSSRQVSAADGTPSWEGRTTSDILQAMGNPDRIETDGKGGSILVYETAPDYSSPDYDILAPESSASVRRYANFYLDAEGRCYHVDTNRNLPAPTRYRPSVNVEFWLDVLYYLPLLTLLVLL
ncbi:MAG: hypothetical protein J6P62_06555 [Bacteroidales bacterium]|nr:hypothetical protein [Bacteroidales bacterium]